MKRLVVLSLVLMFLLTGCNAVKQNKSTEEGNFRFCSLEWGIDWETAQKYDVLQNVESEITENGHRQTVTIEGIEYLGVQLDMIGLVFDIAGITETAGLSNVFLQYSEADEATLLNKLTELYGERKNSYLDKNGVENGINPAGWVSGETVEDVLTEEEKEYYISMFPEDYEQTRMDANLRSPLVSIRFDEERNMIEFNGNTASVVAHVKAELSQ